MSSVSVNSPINHRRIAFNGVSVKSPINHRSLAFNGVTQPFTRIQKCQWTISLRPAMMAALIPPVIGSVTSQANTIFRNNDQSTLSRDRKRPTKTTEPTLQWVVLMGTPMLEAIRTVSAEPISIQNPLEKRHKYRNLWISRIMWRTDKTYHICHKLAGIWSELT